MKKNMNRCKFIKTDENKEKWKKKKNEVMNELTEIINCNKAN